MEVVSCLKNRRSIRSFQDREVSREVMEEIVGLASFSPSWKNTQVVRYTMVTDREIIEKIANECVLGFHYNRDTLKKCKVLAVQSVITKRSGYERDGSFTTGKGAGWETFDAGISAQTFCLAAYELGLGTCIMGIFDDEKIAPCIRLPEGQVVSALIAMGYPAEEPQMPKRKAVEELVNFL